MISEYVIPWRTFIAITLINLMFFTSLKLQFVTSCISGFVLHSQGILFLILLFKKSPRMDIAKIFY